MFFEVFFVWIQKWEIKGFVLVSKAREGKHSMYPRVLVELVAPQKLGDPPLELNPIRRVKFQEIFNFGTFLKKCVFSKCRFPKKSDFSAPKGRPVVAILIGFRKKHTFFKTFHFLKKGWIFVKLISIRARVPHRTSFGPPSQITLLIGFSVFYNFLKKLEKHEKA